MRIQLIIPTLICLVAPASLAQTLYEPDLQGFVTRAASASDFDVNGIHVRTDGKTKIYRMTGNTRTLMAAQDWKPYVGQVAQVFGKSIKGEQAIAATRVNLPRQETGKVSGFGVIDALPPDAAPSPGTHLLRADGYLILVTRETALTFQPPLTAATAFQTNVWISFHGTQRVDGVVVANKASFQGNSVNESEGKLRERTEHDPSAVAPSAKQSGMSKAFRGIDPSQIPPYKDAAMQARISAIGEKLVPEYQRQLAATDETKINFRFQLVDQEKWHDAVTWPNGIILVPRQVVVRMQNDSQLAAVLADNIACALEKQTFRILPAMHKMRAAQLAESIGGSFVPGLGLATIVANSAVSEKMLRHDREQRARVSLFLMHDAGYDLTQAPVAWWLLAEEDEKVNERGEPMLPKRSAYLFKTLGEIWHGEQH